jgi:hypothetical protein
VNAIVMPPPLDVTTSDALGRLTPLSVRNNGELVEVPS